MTKKLMTRALSIMLALALSFTIIPLSANADETENKEVNGADAIIATATSQVGYYEGSGGYSKYGDYFGRPYVAWCGAFVSWCARTTGIPQDVIPTNLSSTAMRDYFIGKGLYHLAPMWGGSYTPKKGDLVFFTSTDTYNRSKNNITHIGFVVNATSSYVTCVEGNCPDRVRQIDRQYSSYIVGYATPLYEGVELENTVTETTYKAGTYKTDEVMNFRTAPGESVITTIPAGTTLEVTAIQGVWGKTEYNGKTGWLSLEYSTYIKDNSSENTEENEDEPTEPTPTPSPSVPEEGKKQYRVTEEMIIREKATKYSKDIGTVPAGTLIQVDEVTEDNWGKISYGGTDGWMCLDWSVEFSPEVDWLVMDISQWQAPEDLNWTKLRDAGVKGVILRIGGRYPSGEKKIYTDDSFMEHYKNAKAAGMHVGVYFFSYALTKNEAIEEAQYCVDTIKENNMALDLPVYIDMEDLIGDTQHISAGKTVCTMVLDEFCKTVEDAGYYAGIYCSRSFAEDFADPSVFENRSTWIADWSKDVCCYGGEVDVWQYTENGKIDGAKYEIDLNRMYVDYPTLINGEKFENGLLEAGDIDCNGTVSAADSRLALRHAVDLEKFNLMQRKLADVNNDGDVTASDARLILRMAIGM